MGLSDIAQLLLLVLGGEGVEVLVASEMLLDTLAPYVATAIGTAFLAAFLI